MKKLLRKLSKSQQVPEPRPLEEIQSEYNQLSGKAGQNQYQSYVLAKDLESINKRLIEVNQEAAYRQKLDAAAEVKADAEAVGAESSQQ